MVHLLRFSCMFLLKKFNDGTVKLINDRNSNDVAWKLFIVKLLEINSRL